MGRGRDFSPYAPMGIISVVSNEDINWRGEETIASGGTAGDFVRRALGLRRDDEKVLASNAEGLINEAEGTLRKILAEAGVFGLADKERVTSSTAYARAEADRGTDQAAAEDYRFVRYRDRKMIAELCRETGLGSLLHVNFEFTKEMVSGIGKNGKCRANVIMTAILLSPEGKILLRKEIETFSSEKIEVSGGGYSHQELMEIFKEPIGEACYRFVWEFTGFPKAGS